MTLQDIADALRAKSWQDLPAGTKTTAKQLLGGDRGFTDAQRAWFAGRWLAITQTDIDSTNKALPASTQVGALDIDGTLYLNADILTDSQDPGSTYFAARAVIKRLVLAEVTPKAPAAAADAAAVDAAPVDAKADPAAKG